MQIDLDLNEAKVLLTALSMFRLHIKEEIEDITQLAKKQEERREAREQKSGGHFCCLDFRETSEEEKFINKLQNQNKFCANLRDKLKMHQMKFPCEEQPKDRKYMWDDENAKKLASENL